MNFYLINHTTWKVPKKLLNWVMSEIQKSLENKHKILRDCEVGLVFVSSSKMTELNSQFRKKDRVTDILSFGGEGLQLGELVICSDVVKRQAREHGLHSYEELSYLLLHGILHLLGYDHETNARDAKKMMTLQDRIFDGLRDQNIPAKAGATKNGKSKFKKRVSVTVSRRQKSDQQNGRKGRRT